MKKCLVIGSNGFLGSLLSRYLTKLGHETHGVYHKNTDNVLESIPQTPIDLIDEVATDFDWVFITSAFIPDRESMAENQKLYDSNVKTVQMMVTKFEASRIIFCSSVSVYGAREGYFKEDSNISPNSQYGLSKSWGELEVQGHSNYAIVRIASMYGIGMKKTTFIPKVIENAILENSITLYGDGKREQNYIHVDDVIDVLLKSAGHSSNSIFLAASDESMSNTEVAELITQNLPECKIRYKGEDTSSSYFYDASYTKQVLGFSPSTTLQKGVSELIAWMKK